MKRLLLCANPAASGFTGGLHRDVLARFRSEFDVESEWPKTPADTRTISAAAAAGGMDIVVAMGGDGVVHHVANGVAATGTSLGIIPAGTTNVLARIMNIPARPRQAAELICGSALPRAIPSAVMNIQHQDGTAEQRLATFSTGAGFDAEVVEVAEQEPFRKYRFGGIHYARTAASVGWRDFADRTPTLTVSADGRASDAVAVLVQLHDVYTYFGRLPLRFGPHRRGTATVLVARDLPRRRIAALLAGTATGRDLTRIDGIEVWDGVERLTVTWLDGTTPAQADGELLGTPKSMTIDVEAHHLRVIAPPGKPPRNRLNLRRA